MCLLSVLVFLESLTCRDILYLCLVSQKRFCFVSLGHRDQWWRVCLQNKELPPNVFDEGAWREFVFLSGQQLVFSLVAVHISVGYFLELVYRSS